MWIDRARSGRFGVSHKSSRFWNRNCATRKTLTSNRRPLNRSTRTPRFNAPPAAADASMRVLHIGKFFPPHPGGIERTSADLCVGLAAKGAEVAVLAHAEPGTRHTTTQRIDDVEVTLVACLGRLLYAPISPTFPVWLRRVITRFRPEILHLHVPNTSAFSALMLPSARRLPWILHWHADIPIDSRHAGLRVGYSLYRPWEQALLRRARAIIVTSPDYAESSAALEPWRSKVHVVPLGISDVSAPQP